jgi:hypothetical protein
MTIVEPGGARTEFRYGSAQVADPLPVYEDVDPAPLRMVLGAGARRHAATLRQRIANFEAQTLLAASTDFPPGE